RERAKDLLRRHADLEGRVAFGVDRLGSGHAAGHPEEDAGVGGWLRVRDLLGAMHGARLAPGKSRQPGSGHVAKEITTAEGIACVDHGIFSLLILVGSRADVSLTDYTQSK